MPGNVMVFPGMKCCGSLVHSCRTMAVLGRRVHHAQHVTSAGPSESPNECRRESEECEIEPRGIIPCDRRFDDPGLVLLRNEPKHAEDKLNDQRSPRHGRIKR